MGVPSETVVDLSGDGVMPVGVDTFEKVVREYIYVDKTPLIAELLDSKAETVLFCRPRRFGKSLAMSMLQRFLETPVEGWIREYRDLFEPLAIWRAGERYRQEQGAYPVVSLSLKASGGETWEQTRISLAMTVAAEYARHGYLRDDLRSPLLAERFDRLEAGVPGPGELESSLVWLCQLLARHHGAPCVVLVDEYDAPVTAGHARGYRDEAVTFMRNWLTDAVKSNPDLRLACLTGVQRVSRESIFSGLNNLTVDTSLDPEFSEGFGFTEAETEALLAHAGHADRVGEVREWYDGYCFGGTATYNPWSVISYVRYGCVAQPYWTNTSGNQIVHDLFVRATAAGGQDAADLSSLADGGTATHPLDLSTDFALLDHDLSAVWPQLYLSGYVTTDDVERPADAELPRRLRVPNLEVRRVYRHEFLGRARSLAGDRRRLDALHAALVAGDAGALEDELASVLLDSASARDLVRENSCHMLLLGLLYCVPGYLLPESNRERGRGIPDIVLLPDREHEGELPPMVVEVKWAGEAGQGLPALAASALEQVRGRAYARGLERPLLWGVAFRGRDVAVACERG